MSTQHDDFLRAIEDNYPAVSDFLRQQCRAGGYSFFGSYIPLPGYRDLCKTFSVGVFQWQPRRSGAGLKPGKAIIRVNGFTDNPTAVYDMAMDLCRRLQNGERFPFKSISAARYRESAT